MVDQAYAKKWDEETTQCLLGEFQGSAKDNVSSVRFDIDAREKISPPTLRLLADSCIPPGGAIATAGGVA